MENVLYRAQDRNQLSSKGDSFLQTLYLQKNFLLCIGTMHTIMRASNRPFPRSMRNQGKRPGRGSRQTGAVFEA